MGRIVAVDYSSSIYLTRV